VRLLIDANLPPKVGAALGKAGVESVHVRDVVLPTAPDRGILDYAAANALVTVSADSDFGVLLAAAGAAPAKARTTSTNRSPPGRGAAAAAPPAVGRRFPRPARRRAPPANDL